MTDLTTVLPHFPTHQYVRLLPSLEKQQITTADLLTLDGLEIAKRASLPVLDVKRLCKAVLAALQVNLGVPSEVDGKWEERDEGELRRKGEQVLNGWKTVTTLDDELDRVLGGGVPTGSITEVTGESGAGKTQFLLTLLLSAQLPAPQGLGGATLYISTESALPVTRLNQLLLSHPVLSSFDKDSKPSMDRIISIVTPDLESQDHILRYQVPVAIKRHGIRLLILDSVAANYRAEFERGASGGGGKRGADMAQRSGELVKLGQLLRDLARENDIAVVVANQVADRFSGSGNSNYGGSSPLMQRGTQSSTLARRGDYGGPPPSLPMSSNPGREDIPTSMPFQSTSDPMSLDHQQRWFTGWGDDPHPSHLTLKSMKTPSLGLIWTAQIACRIALIKRPVYGPAIVSETTERGEPVLRRWRRWMKVVFAAHAKWTGPGLEGAVQFEIKGQGLVAVKKGRGFIEEGEYEAAGGA